MNRNGTPTSIFVSYARRDGSAASDRLKADLDRQGFDVWLDRYSLKAGASWTLEIERRLDSCDVVLALLTKGAYDSEMCRAEQLRALRHGKCVIPLRMQPGVEMPFYLETSQFLDFTDPDAHDTQFQALLAGIRDRKAGAGLAPAYRETYVTYPPLPRNLIDRPDDLARLRERIISEDAGRTIALTALAGMGGIGKTVLAQALCKDEAVQAAFPDGVAWVTIGKDREIPPAAQMKEIGAALRDRLAECQTELECVNRYRTVMRDRAVLLILDDVWDARAVEPFRAESQRSRLLVTTRDASIAAALGADQCTTNLLTPDEAWTLLSLWSRSTREQLREVGDQLVAECAGLPLAVSMVGAMIRGRPLAYAKRLLELLRTANLEGIGIQFSSYPHRTLLSAIQISVDELSPPDRARYLACAVLPDDMPVHPAVQEAIWTASEGEALETSERFVELSLAQRADDEGAIRLHDLQLDYVRARYPERQALEVILRAARLSQHIVTRDPWQFRSQLCGRLLPYANDAAVGRFVATLRSPSRRPWLRPTSAALITADSGALFNVTMQPPVPVHCIGIAPDGLSVASVSEQGAVQWWDVQRGIETHRLQLTPDEAGSASVSAARLRVAYCAHTRTLKVWDGMSQSPAGVLEADLQYVRALAISGNGLRIAAADGRGLCVWDVESPMAPRRLEGSFGVGGVLALSGDGRVAVSMGRADTLTVWNLDTNVPRHQMKVADSKVKVAIDQEGRRAVLGGHPVGLGVWDLHTGELMAIRGVEWANCVAISDDGRWIAANSMMERANRVWDLAGGEPRCVFDWRDEWCEGLGMSAGGRRLLSAGFYGALKVWQVGDAAARSSPRPGHTDQVTDIAVGPSGGLVVSASLDSTLKVWNPDSGEPVMTLTGATREPPVLGAAVDETAGRAFSADGRGAIKEWDLDTGVVRRTFDTAAVRALALDTYAGRLLSGSDDGTLKVWCLRDGSEVRAVQAHRRPLRGLAVAPRHRRAISASQDGVLMLWDLDTYEALQTLTDPSGRTRKVALSGDAMTAVSVSYGGAPLVWDLASGSPPLALRGHDGWVLDIAISPNGHEVVTASHDRTVRLWDLTSRAELAIWTLDVPARSCAFVGDDRVVVGDELGSVHFLAIECESINRLPTAVDRWR